MALDYLGELSLRSAMPAVSVAFAAGIGGIQAALPDIEARLTALLAFSPQPVDFAANIALAQSIVVSIQSALALGISPPDISAQIAIVEALVEALAAVVDSINTQLNVVIGTDALLDAAGVFLYAWDGQAGDLGTAVDTALSSGFPGGTGPTQDSNALVLATTTPSTWTAMSSLFKVTV